MNQHEYNDWLKNLKIGDEVRIAIYPIASSYNSKIKIITKTGKFRLETGELFNRFGDRNTIESYKRLYPINTTGY